NLAFSLDEASGTGSLSIKGGAQPHWRIELAADHLDLDRLELSRYGVTHALEIGSGTQGEAASGPEPEGLEQPAVRQSAATWLWHNLDPRWLQTAAAVFDVKLGSLRYDGVDMTELGLDLRLENGNLEIRRADIGELAGARVRASGEVTS